MDLTFGLFKAVSALFIGRPKRGRESKIKVECPCCGYRTLERDAQLPDLCQWNICHVCFWEDDDWFEGGGANEPTLAEARENFAKFGAIEERFVRRVRPPRKDEQ
jgi:hypothetical protein